MGGSPSGAVSPDTESASASNLPQSDTTLVADTPYSYADHLQPGGLADRPGDGPGLLQPGGHRRRRHLCDQRNADHRDHRLFPAVRGGRSRFDHGQPATPIPTFQVPSPTPPLQNQVSAGTDGGWATTISNTSTATVTGLTARVNVSDGGAALTYDLAGMAASGTNCATAGSGTLTCTVPNLAAGSSDTLDVLVDTTDSCRHHDHRLGHGELDQCRVPCHHPRSHRCGGGGSGTDTKAVAAPGIPLISTKKRLKVAKASVTLTLPKQKIRKPKGADRVAAGLGGGRHDLARAHHRWP